MNVTYTFYVEVNLESKDNLSPIITHMIKISDGSIVQSKPSVSPLSSGFYKFEYDWSNDSQDGYLLKIDTGLEDGPEKIITMRIEKSDYLPDVASRIETSTESLETSATSLITSANDLQSRANRLLDIEQGTWKIEGTQLAFYSAGYSANVDQEIARYDLTDANGNPTNVNPFRRVLVELTGSPTP